MDNALTERGQETSISSGPEGTGTDETLAGVLQPHGALLVLSPTGLIEQSTPNAARLLGGEADDVNGSLLAEHLEERSADDVATLFAALEEGHEPPRFAPLPLRSRAGRALGGLAHLRRREGLRLLELEPLDDLCEAPEEPRGPGACGYTLLAPHLDALRGCKSLADLYQESTRAAQSICGWDRATLLVFDNDGAGEIVAETSRREPAYRGMRMPASEIPTELRRRYQHERVRCIVDLDAPAVALAPGQNPRTGRTVNLEEVGLRALSEHFRRYLRAMETKSSLSVAIISGDTLAGLLLCFDHERGARPSFAIRQACELLGFLVATRRGELLEVRRLRNQVRAGARCAQLLARLSPEQLCPAELLTGHPSVLDLINADGAAWVSAEGPPRTTGRTPSDDALRALGQWLDAEVARSVFATRSLEQVYGPARELRSSAAGLLAVQLPGVTAGWLLWLRGELASSVSWNRGAAPSNTPGPEHSFAEWQRSVEGCAAPWSKEARDAAAALREGLLERALRHAERSRRELELERRQARRWSALGHLAAGYANDFNNLLHVLESASALAQETLGRGGDVAPLLERVDGALGRATALTNQMLAFSGRNVELVASVDLSELIGRLTLLDGMVADAANLERVLATDLPQVEVDVTQLQQLVVNLVLQASESLEGNAGTIVLETARERLELDRGRLKAAEYVSIAVSSDERALGEATRRALGEATRRALEDGARERLHFGVEAVTAIAHECGGDVFVERSPERGSLVRVLLPTVCPIARRPEDKASTTPARPAEEQSRRVLVVDDEDLVRDVALTALERAGWRGIPAANGQQALDIYEAQGDEIDLVLLDLSLPGIGGGEVWQRLRQRDPDVKVLFSSGLSTKALPAEALAAGCAFLQKPYKPRALMNELRAVLER